jgi:hypothetical protein
MFLAVTGPYPVAQSIGLPPPFGFRVVFPWPSLCAPSSYTVKARPLSGREARSAGEVEPLASSMDTMGQRTPARRGGYNDGSSIPEVVRL